MATSTFNTKVRDILKKEANRAADNASKAMYNIARRTIGSAVDHSINVRVKRGYAAEDTVTIKTFYGDYPRKKGKRLSYNRTGNLENSFAATLHPYGETGTMAQLEFATKYMTEDYHLDSKDPSKRTPYDKEAVLKYDYEDGWHGQPVYYGHEMPQMKPSPAERIAKEIDGLTMARFITDADAEKVIDKIYSLMDAEIEKYKNDG